jgi:putative phosphonate metabolism protein
MSARTEFFLKQMFTAALRQAEAAIPVSRRTIASAARYAIYFAPPRESAWWTFGCAWLGRDPITDVRMTWPALDKLNLSRLSHITSAPRRYGFHATLKPPFRLAPGHCAEDLHQQTAALAASLKPVSLPPLRLAEIDGFVALCFADECDDVRRCNAIAAQCVSRFDHLRAPADALELARRQVAGLSVRQAQLLAAWGYPYVFDDFRFHLTLTGRLSRVERHHVMDVLTPIVATLQGEPLPFDALTVYAQPQPEAPFVVTRRYGFDGRVEIYRDPF